jgi:PAS domain S-box-containing protein
MSSLPDSGLSISELDALFHQSPIALVFLDSGQRVRRTNAASRRLTGFPDEAIIGRRPTEVDSGMDAAWHERILAGQVINRGVPVVDVHLEQTLPGNHRVVSWSACRVMENGQVVGALCSFRDITSQVTSLQQAHALLERAGHQIGTTLDIRSTAAELADLAIPGLADRITVNLLDQVLQGEDRPRTGSGILQFRRVALRETSETRAKASYKVGDLIPAPLTSSRPPGRGNPSWGETGPR